MLTKQEFAKCKSDAVFDVDIVVLINYISQIKTDLLPKYRSARKGIVVSNDLQISLGLLKTTYDEVLERKVSTFTREMDKNQKFVQPKAYVASLLSFQTFWFYPDVYAILLNDIHLRLSPKTQPDEIISYGKLVDEAFSNIPSNLLEQLEIITTALKKDHDELMKHGFSPPFQGSQSLEEKRKYSIINFLLWEY